MHKLVVYLIANHKITLLWSYLRFCFILNDCHALYIMVFFICLQIIFYEEQHFQDKLYKCSADCPNFRQVSGLEQYCSRCVESGTWVLYENSIYTGMKIYYFAMILFHLVFLFNVFFFKHTELIQHPFFPLPNIKTYTEMAIISLVTIISLAEIRECFSSFFTYTVGYFDIVADLYHCISSSICLFLFVIIHTMMLGIYRDY